MCLTSWGGVGWGGSYSNTIQHVLNLRSKMSKILNNSVKQLKHFKIVKVRSHNAELQKAVTDGNYAPRASMSFCGHIFSSHLKLKLDTVSLSTAVEVLLLQIIKVHISLSYQSLENGLEKKMHNDQGTYLSSGNFVHQEKLQNSKGILSLAHTCLCMQALLDYSSGNYYGHYSTNLSCQ